MRSSRYVLAILLVASAAASGDARALSTAGGLTDDMRSLYAEMFGDYLPTQTTQSLQNRARETVAAADLNGGGLSQRDIELARGMAESSSRADRIRQYFGSDLDRDGVLTLAEYETRLRASSVQNFYYRYERARAENGPVPAAFDENLSRSNASALETFNSIDSNQDGRLTLQEAYDYDQPVVYGPAERFVEAAKYLALDSNGDGNVTMEEVDATSAAFLAEQTLAGVGPLPQGQADKEGDGSVSLEDAVQCRFPSPAAAARIVRLGTREGGQLSNLALGGPDEATYVVNVDIEPGTEPLYIVATSDYPTIWRFSGATQRVQALVASSGARDARRMWPAVGVTGLPRARFHTVPNACFGEFAETHMGAYLGNSEASQLVQRRLGRPIDIAFGAYQPQGVRLPSVQPFTVPAQVPEIFRNPRNEDAAREWRDFLGYFPAGIAELNARQIVTRAFPEPYQVYSYGAGVAQLLELGALTRVTNSSVTFEIHRQIRFPAHLAGGHSETFRLPDGVPPPIGDPGHSRVMSGSNPRICLIGCR